MEAVLPGVLAAFLAAIGAYVVAVRRFSGKIGSSEAAELWKESSSLREWTSDRMKEQDSLISELRGRIKDAEKANNMLMRDNADLQRRVEACEKLGDEIHDLTERLATANRQLAELQGEAGA